MKTLVFSCTLLLSCLLGCAKALPVQNIPIPVPLVDTAHSFMALGDSYTIGQSETAEARFPAQTVALLRARGMMVKDPVYIARTGWTTADLQDAIARYQPSLPYDIVTLLIGVNDQYQHLDTGGYRTRFTQLLRKAIEWAGNKKERVYVLSIPDYGVTPFGGHSARIGREIDDFNRINKEITMAHGVSYIDITPISREPDAALITSDSLHPSAKQYRRWAEKLAAAIR